MKIDGVDTYDKEKIDRYRLDFELSSLKLRLKRDQACGNAGMASLNCKAEDVKVSKEYAKTYREAGRVNTDIASCTKQLGWRYLKIVKEYVPIDEKTVNK